MAVKRELNINSLIRQNQAFAIYRLPGENRLHFIGQTNSSVCIFSDIKSLNEHNGFVIAPFRVSQTCPVILIEAEEEYIFDIPYVISPNMKNEIFRETPSENYRSRFEVFIKALKNNEFEKLVLSRCLAVPSKPGFSPKNVFHRACNKYIHSYVYLFHTPQTGTWIGSTPEILLSGKNNEWHTVALAGTQNLIDGKLPEKWSEKKQEEQQLVTDYIRDCLLSFNISPEEKKPYTVQAGELAHLRTDLRFSLSNNCNISELIKSLHPTPAVCGLPKEKVFQFISDNEGYDRRYYSGFIGRLNPDEQTDLYVNLRCMQVEDSRLLLYAGVGLLASSDLEEEWLEIEDKLQTMFRIIE